MNLYEVIFCDSGKERNDDADTIYLVRAPDFQTAVGLFTDTMGKHPLPDRVHEIGVDLSPSADEAGAMVLRGPYIQCAYTYGWKAWNRKVNDGKKMNEWEEDPNNRELGDKKS